MSELGDLLTEEEIMSFVSIMDVDNDGVIGVRDVA
jgi:Ca2+-binding EF-hand superfamily protein